MANALTVGAIGRDNGEYYERASANKEHIVGITKDYTHDIGTRILYTNRWGN